MSEQGGPTPPFMTQPGQAGGPPPGGPPPAAPSKLTGGKLVMIVLGIVALCAVPVIGVLAAFAIYGVKKYVVNAKVGEASHEVPRLASGIARCAAETEPGSTTKRGLPESSPAVPSSLAAVRGTKYQSSPADWSGAFACAGFSQVGPQYFQYRWEKRSPTTGAVVALADLDGDGAPEVTLEQEVNCPSEAPCTVGTLAKSGP